jgi:hypothetical protein
VVECSLLLHHINKSLLGVGHEEDFFACMLWQELGLPKTFEVCCICLKYNDSGLWKFFEYIFFPTISLSNAMPKFQPNKYRIV